MKRSRFREEQIISILKEHERGAQSVDLCREHGISETTFNRWKSKFQNVSVSEAKQLKALTAENAMLRNLLTDAIIDNATLRELLTDSDCLIVSSLPS